MSSLAALIAQAAPSLFAGNSTLLLVPIFFVIFYVMIIRPQRKQEANTKKFLDALQKGDEVVTSGGIVGKIDKVLEGGLVTLEIANNVRVRMLRAQIAGPFVPAPALAPAGDKAEAAPEKK